MGDRRGVVKASGHPWWRFTGEVLGTMSTPVGDGLRVRLDSGIETFVLPEEWDDFGSKDGAT